MPEDLLNNWRAYQNEHPAPRLLKMREWSGAEFDLGLGPGTELIVQDDIVAVSAWLKLTARRELQLDRIALTGIPGEHGPLQLLSPGRDHRYTFPGGDEFPEDMVFNRHLRCRQRLQPGETIEGLLLAYVQGSLPPEEYHPQPVRLALHVLVPEGRNSRRQPQVLLLEHAFAVLDYRRKPAAAAEAAEATESPEPPIVSEPSAADETGLAQTIASSRLMER